MRRRVQASSRCLCCRAQVMLSWFVASLSFFSVALASRRQSIALVLALPPQSSMPSVSRGWDGCRFSLSSESTEKLGA